jgi:hypothetical protein
MSAALRNLGQQPHGALALKAYLDAHNYILSGLMTEHEAIARIMRTRDARIPEAEAMSAILKGLAAAKRK